MWDLIVSVPDHCLFFYFADPTNADDAITRRCAASRFQALSDEVQGNKRKLDALQNLLGVVNNYVLIRAYEIIGTDSEHNVRLHIDEEGRIIGTSFLFRKHPHVPNDTNEFGSIFDIFTLKDYFIYLLEEAVDDITWLRIKQPGTYTIHFDLMRAGYSSFSFVTHKRRDNTFL